MAPYYFDWLAHRPGDAYWDWAELRGRYGRVGAAVLNLSGWHDEAYGPEGAITNFLGLLAARKGEKDPRTRLVLGPWIHGGEDSGPLGRARVRPDGADRLRGDDPALHGPLRARASTTASTREPRVRAFVMGENVWRTAETLPLPGTQPLSLYLAPRRKALARGPGRRRQRVERLRLRSGATRSSTRTAGRPAPTTTARWRSAPTSLVFETEPLAEAAARRRRDRDRDLPVGRRAGRRPLGQARGRARPTARPGTSRAPAPTCCAASDRDGGPTPKLLAPGEIVALRLPNLRTGNLFAKGHRVRVVLCGSFMPHFSRNLQTGESETRSGKTRPATIRIHHDAAHPSRIVLPVVPDGNGP